MFCASSYKGTTTDTNSFMTFPMAAKGISIHGAPERIPTRYGDVRKGGSGCVYFAGAFFLAGAFFWAAGFLAAGLGAF